MNDKCRVSILDVGHGNSAVLEDTGGVVVIDAGPGSSLLEFLTREGVRRVDLVMISHADADHIEGLIALLGSGEISLGRIYLNTDSEKGSELWDDLLYELDHQDKNNKVFFYPFLGRDESNNLDLGEVHIQVLAPSKYLAAKGPGSLDRAGRRLSPNSLSAVIKLLHRGQPVVLLPGDLDDIGLRNILEESIDLKAPVLVYPHHGGRPGGGDVLRFTEELLLRVAPEVIVFSIGRNRKETPRPEVVSKIKELYPEVRIVCTQLSSQCAADLPNKEPAHLAEVFSRGREQRKCCGGTVVLEIRREGLLPLHDSHQSFISEAAPTALCRWKRIM